ncbi:52 kda repressor of the inhibitor of the protein kinase-like protein [Lasius niger]|uniref:52 kDa repressor of the inhibitor of the protein kinase-like protein n=1 Tax=Lasius niger TaxID=67767 RepID=A0A0J7JUM9_LASNI|nr:52 kda repressor of the inhibitor of the protein kinase-like protein [Lasius niger]
MKSAVDRIQQEISVRFTRLRDLNFKFGFLLDVENLLKEDTVDSNLEKKCVELGEFYETDFNGAELYAEICDCKMLLRSRTESKLKIPSELLAFIISYGEDVFPNLRVAIQILLTISVSIASCERSFSKLKLILTYLRSTMEQDRLSDLALLCIEKETFENVNFDNIIDEFATIKARKRFF